MKEVSKRKLTWAFFFFLGTMLGVFAEQEKATIKDYLRHMRNTAKCNLINNYRSLVYKRMVAKDGGGGGGAQELNYI